MNLNVATIILHKTNVQFIFTCDPLECDGNSSNYWITSYEVLAAIKLTMLVLGVMTQCGRVVEYISNHRQDQMASQLRRLTIGNE